MVVVDCGELGDGIVACGERGWIEVTGMLACGPQSSVVFRDRLYAAQYTVSDMFDTRFCMVTRGAISPPSVT